MDAESDRAAKDWRTRAKERLAGRFILLDPLRRNFRDREIDSANEIVEFDLQDVRDADLLLVNYCKPSLGTAMEVFYAGHDLGKFVIAFSPFSFADSSPWMVRFCTKILPDLESAITYIDRHFPLRGASMIKGMCFAGGVIFGALLACAACSQTPAYSTSSYGPVAGGPGYYGGPPPAGHPEISQAMSALQHAKLRAAGQSSERLSRA